MRDYPYSFYGFQYPCQDLLFREKTYLFKQVPPLRNPSFSDRQPEMYRTQAQ